MPTAAELAQQYGFVMPTGDSKIRDGDNAITQNAVAAAGIISTLADRIRRGTGSPEGVVTANPGDLYADSALTHGAAVWRKAAGTGNTGWEVAIGDTGWRNIAGLLTAPASCVITRAVVRRIGRQCQLIVTWRDSQTNPFRQNVSGIPAGFSCDAWAMTTVPYDAAASPAMRHVALSGSVFQYGGDSHAGGFDARIVYTTGDPWPTPLPGGAA